MNFPLDDSTQTNTALLTTGTSSTYVDSNDLSTKQNVLDASTNLLGIGTSIRDLNYNNITINKLILIFFGIYMITKISCDFIV